MIDRKLNDMTAESCIFGIDRLKTRSLNASYNISEVALRVVNILNGKEPQTESELTRLLSSN